MPGVVHELGYALVTAFGAADHPGLLDARIVGEAETGPTAASYCWYATR